MTIFFQLPFLHLKEFSQESTWKQGDVKTDTSATVEQETSVSTGVNSPRGFEEPKHDPLDQGAGAPPVPPEHSCHKSPSCKPILGLLGCVELYKLTSVNERHLYCRLSNCCDKCGAATYPNHSAPLQDGDGKQKHKCSWGDSKMIAHCTKDQCRVGAAICRSH